MKILTKKQWRMLDIKFYNLKKELSDTQYSLHYYIKRTDDLKKQCKNLEESKRKLASAKGGLNAKIKRLENEIKHLKELQVEMDKQYLELEEKYKESMTDKYLVKKLKPGRTPKTTSMKLKDCSRVSNITRKVISHYEKDI